MEELDWNQLNNEILEHNECCGTVEQHLAQGDWADDLAAKWLEIISYIYKHKKRPDGLIHHPIVHYTGTALQKAVEENYGIQKIDFDDYDWGTMLALQNNVWRFSIAKNYNDLIALNNLLVDEEGNLRNWNDFKEKAYQVVGRSNRYLKTEYNTAVLTSQNARLWNHIQRNKHIFPFVQFDVVVDGHTSDICKPLHGVVVPVNSPILERYFPPNHFNCRTTVRLLRNAEPTPTDKIQLPKIPKAFLQNPGMTGNAFSAEHSYFQNMPKKLLMNSSANISKTKFIEKFKHLIETNQARGIYEMIQLDEKIKKTIHLDFVKIEDKALKHSTRSFKKEKGNTLDIKIIIERINDDLNSVSDVYEQVNQSRKTYIFCSEYQENKFIKYVFKKDKKGIFELTTMWNC